MDTGLPAMENSQPNSNPIQEDWNTANPTQDRISVTELLMQSAQGQILRGSYGNQPCVVKYIYNDKARRPSTDLEFKNEINALTALQGHPLFPKLFGHGFTNKAYYLFIPFYQNGDLMDFIFNEIHAEHTSIQSAVTTNNTKLKIYAKDILLAIEHMHSKKILHLDLKPENIVLSDDESRVIIIDFGLAKMKTTDELITSYPTTENYTAPEVYKTKQCGEPADLWSYGVILYCMFEGFLPFNGENEIVNDEHSPPYHKWQAKNTKDVIIKLLNRNPRQRLTVEEAKIHPFFGSSIDFETRRDTNTNTTTEYIPTHTPSTNTNKRTSQSQSHQPTKKRNTAQ
jgi:serine/threonine protein kinase